MGLSDVVRPVGRLSGGSVQLLGTAFAVGQRLMATALHTVGTDHSNLVIVAPRSSELEQYQDTTDISVASFPVDIAHADPLRDLCILSAPEDISFFSSYELGSTDELQVGDPVFSIGYPHADVGRMVITRQDMAIGARVLLENEGIKSKHAVLNSLIRPGQSGGPVFYPKNGTVVAIMVGPYTPHGGGGIKIGNVDPATLHQTTHAVSAEYLKEMLA